MRGGIPLQPHLGKTDTTDFEAQNSVLGSQVAVPVEALTAVNRISFLQLPTQGAVAESLTSPPHESGVHTNSFAGHSIMCDTDARTNTTAEFYSIPPRRNKTSR